MSGSGVLESLPKTELNEYVVKLCQRNQITTVNQFLNENTDKLCDITNLSKTEISNIKKILTDKYCIKLKNAYVSYEKLKHTLTTIIPTGIKSLDKILKGGIMIGNLIEICGYSSAGKTLFCITVAINLANEYKFDTFYIDLKYDLQGSYVYKILNERKLSNNEIYNIMNRIHVERLSNAKDIINLLKNLIQNIDSYKNFKLLIIDSIPSVWLLYNGDKTTEGMALLTELTILLRILVHKHQKIVIVVNILTKWMDCDLENNDFAKSQTTIIKPSLGKFWETIPTLRLLIQQNIKSKNYCLSVENNINQYQNIDNNNTKNNINSEKIKKIISIMKNRNNDENDEENGFKIKLNTLSKNQRLIRIIKSCWLRTGKRCIVDINEMGIM